MRNFFIAMFFSPLLLLAAVLLGNAAFAQNDDEDDQLEVPVVTDLTTLTQLSEQRLVPIVLMFSAEDCDYCERLEENVIRPMLLSGDFDRRAIFRKVMIDSADQLKDFTGHETDAEEFANARDIQVTPTLGFFDSNGNQLAPNVVGYQISGLYTAYLDVAIDASHDFLIKNGSVKNTRQQ